MLDFYRRPAAMTSGGTHVRMLDAVPRDLAGMARVVQGLLLHEHWAPAYGVTLSDERRRESHIRPASLMLDRLLADGGQRFWSLGQWRRASSGSAATSRCCSSPCCVPREFPPAPVAASAPISIPVTSRTTGSP